MAMRQPLNHQKEKIMPYFGLMFFAKAIAVETSFNACITSAEDIKALCKEGRFEDAMRVLRVVDHPNPCIYICILQEIIEKKALPEGKLVHAHINQRGFKPNRFLCNTLLNMYSKCGSVADARRVFEQMPERNVLSWTVMISAYTSSGVASEALKLFHEMQRTGVQPNQFTFSSVLPACGSLAALEDGMKIHEEIMGRGFQSDVFVGSALVDMYAKCGRIEDARDVFDKMHQRDVVSWNTMLAGYAQNGLMDEALRLFKIMPVRNMASWNAMITGYTQNGQGEEALKLFRQMQLTGVKPDSMTFASILSACASVASLDHGMEVHEKVIGNDFGFDIVVVNALVDMYAKCGSIKKAQELFDKMHQRDIVSWTAMIAGYAMHGYGKEALKLFETMKHFGPSPDHVTFVCILSACNHAGLVDEGYQYFNSMSSDYHMSPTMEHYSCMVDLLGRAGLLDEAHKFINNIPVKVDSAVWGCLLGACRIHHNVELGELVAEHIFELDPKNAGSYVLLSNIYAAAGRWDDIEKVRKIMNDKSIKRTPGCSWIEVNKQMHTFLVGDTIHPQTQKSYIELDRLS